MCYSSTLVSTPAFVTLVVQGSAPSSHFEVTYLFMYFPLQQSPLIQVMDHNAPNRPFYKMFFHQNRYSLGHQWTFLIVKSFTSLSNLRTYKTNWILCQLKVGTRNKYEIINTSSITWHKTLFPCIPSGILFHDYFAHEQLCVWTRAQTRVFVCVGVCRKDERAARVIPYYAYIRSLRKISIYVFTEIYPIRPLIGSKRVFR